MLRQLADLKMVRDLGPGDPKVFGLAQPALQVFFIAKDKQHSLTLGEAVPGGEGYYARKDDSPGIFIIVTLGFLLAVYALYCYATEPNSARLLALGLATGLALCVKHSMVLLAIVLPVLLFSDALLCGREGLRRRLLHRAGALLAVAAIAFVVLWTCYGFRYAARPGSGDLERAPVAPRSRCGGH